MMIQTMPLLVCINKVGQSLQDKNPQNPILDLSGLVKGAWHLIEILTLGF